MSKFTIPNTNVAISDTLKDGGAFAGVPVSSLNCYGSNHRWPRVTSNISIDTHFRNRDFVRFACVFSTDENGLPLGTVEVTSPQSLGPAQSVSLGVTYVFITSTTFTLQASTVSGYSFTNWTDLGTGNSLSLANPVTLSLTDAQVAASTAIQAIYFPVGGT